MNEELLYYNNIPESVGGCSNGFKKSCDHTGDSSEGIKFYPAPFSHPLSGILGIVKRAYEKYRLRSVAFHVKRKRNAAIQPDAVLEACNTAADKSNNIPQPLPRKATGGSGNMLMMLRHPAMNGAGI